MRSGLQRITGGIHLKTCRLIGAGDDEVLTAGKVVGAVATFNVCAIYELESYDVNALICIIISAPRRC